MITKPRDTGYVQQLALYFKRNIQKGYNTESLKIALMNQGHSRMEVDRALNLANEQLALQAPKMMEKPVIKVEIEPPVVQEKSLWQKFKGLFS